MPATPRWSFLLLMLSMANASALPQKGAPQKPASPASTLANSAKIKPLKVLKLEIQPPTLTLTGPRSSAYAVAIATYQGGGTKDVTREVTWNVSSPQVAVCSSPGELRAKGDGKAVLAASLNGLKARTNVVAIGVAANASVDFALEIAPILTRSGCNMGSCHGAAAGKGGFALSLFGAFPDQDYQSIVRALGARRVDTVAPKNSLFLKKPLLGVAHGGGKRLDLKSADYRILLDWLQAGAPAPSKTAPEVVKVDVYPKERILQQGEYQSLVVVATYSDGSVRDITPWAKFRTLNDGVAKITPEGVVESSGRGQASIIVWFSGQSAVFKSITPFAMAKTAPADLQSDNFIDKLVQQKWAAVGLRPSATCDDATFIRRIMLDVIGTLPTAAEVTTFLADSDPKKREKLVDTVLARPEYADYWTLKWGDLLRSNRGPLGPKGMWSLTNWIRGEFRDNVPMDQFVSNLITAQGSTFTEGPANYYRVARNPNELAETTAQVFLGTRLQCAKCHNHPTEKWKQTDYYQFAGFFARVGIKGSNEFGIFGGDQVVRLQRGGEVYHPKDGRLMTPRPLGGFATFQLTNDTKTNKPVDPNVDAGGDRRRYLADWMTRDNPLFAANIANRYWGYLMGRGLVMPVDDLRASNPPTNPELMDALSKYIVEQKYDVKKLIRAICTSKTYQLSSDPTKGNSKDEQFYTHYLARRIPAEALLDAVDSVTGIQEKFGGLPAGTRAIQLPDPTVNSEFLDVFGRAPRLIACECERSPEPNMAQALHLMMAYNVNRKVQEENAVVNKRIKQKKTDREIIEEIYLRTVGRKPSSEEVSRAEQTLRETIEKPGQLPQQDAPWLRKIRTKRHDYLKEVDRRQTLEDILWALINTPEFAFNH